MSLLISIAILAGLAVWGYGCYRACAARTSESLLQKTAVRRVRGKRFAIALLLLVPAAARVRAKFPTPGGCAMSGAGYLRLLLLAFVGLFGVSAGQRAMAQGLPDFNVNSVADKVDAKPGDGICSTGSLLADGHTPECTLRAAIDETNALQPANPARHFVVSVMAGTYSLSTNETCIFVNLGSQAVSTATNSVLCISSNLTLNGAGQATTIVDHGLTDRDFFTSYGFNIAINNMTIQNGGQYGGSFNGTGGGIDNQGTLTLSNDLILNNHSDNGGAGVDNNGTLVVEGCTFMGNSGPAITAEHAVTSIDTSYFTQNTAGGGAAVSDFAGSVQISNSTASGNTVGAGGIVAFDFSTATITNSTISNNTIGNSGAVSFSSSIGTLNGVTISGNTAGNSIGGLLGGNITMSNTILAGNSGYDCAVDSLTDAGHNLIQTPSPGGCKITSSTLIGVDAKLDTLALNGGLVPTQQPQPGSPAIGGGSSVRPGSNAAGACTALDERGVFRGSSGVCTIGAAEPAASSDNNYVAISPSVGARGGTARVIAYGSPFVTGSTIALQKSGQPNIPVLQSTLAPDNSSITALLDLSKAVLGSYDLVVTTPAGASTSLPAAYTVQEATAPDLYSYIYGFPVDRPGRPAFYTFVYGNKGNADTYLVPMSIQLPGGFAGLVSSQILSPPAATGQVIRNWTDVPLQVLPYSTTGFSNVPLIIPVLPAGYTGVLQFSVQSPAGSTEGTEYTIDGGLGDPYATASNGTADSATLAAFVAGAQSYAQANLGVTLTSSELAQMSTYASTQLAQEVSAGGQALLQSSLSNPVVFSNSQLILDIATYGASLAAPNVAAASSSQKAVQQALGVHPDSGALPTLPVNPCTGAILQPGTSCTPTDHTVPTDGGADDKPFTAAECRSLPNYHVSADGTECVENPRSGCSPIPVTLGPPQCNRFPIVGSIDPNEKDGPLGIGTAHFTLANNPFGYQVEFENTPTATAPAQTVSVTDPLDKSQYDLSTFQLGPISFGPYVVSPPPGLTSFSKALDLRPSENVIVSINANLNKSTGVATWNFTSLDPATMQLVTDPTAGFLPPDANPPAGIGRVAFSVQPLASVASGAKICNTASIVFDVNSPIATAPYCNSKDTTGPVSAVASLAATQSQPSFTVSWSGTDAGVGIFAFSIYVSVDGGPFTVWQNQTTSTSAVYPGATGHSYGFYSIATDQLGNTEGTKTKAETTTVVSSGTSAAIPTFSPAGGVYNSAQMVAISDATPAAAIYYTTNGSMPTTQSTLYTGPVSIKTTETLQAIAVAAAYAQSPVASATYTITPASVPAPTFSPTGGTFTAAQTVKLADATVGVIIHYTVDGSTPNASSAVYSAPIAVPVTETIKAIAIASNTSSPIASTTYTIATSTGQTITFPSLAAQTYGAVPIHLAATATSGLPVSYSVTGPAKLSGASLALTGAGAVTVTASQSGNASFTAAVPVTRSFAIAKAPLTVTASSFTRAFGAPNPAFTYKLSGFVNGDTATVVGGTAVLATTAVPTSPAGNYPITFSTEGLTATNYSFIYVAGSLTVTPGTLVIAPSSGNFGSVEVGTTSPVISFTVTNNTASTMGYLGYTNLGEFYLQLGTCHLVNGEPMLKPGQSCVFTAVFKPTRAGAVSGNLSIQTSSGTFNVPMTGTGSTLVISPASGNFGTIAVGKISPTISFTVTNDTTSTMGYLGYSNLGEFYLQPGTCHLVNGEPMLKPGQSCIFTAAFKPTKAGAVNGVLSIQTSSGPFNVPMTGTGVTP